MTCAKFVLLEAHEQQLRRLLFDRPGIEGAAFLLCGESRSDTVVKLLSHAVVPIADEDILQREADSLSISSRALMRIAKLARYERLSIVFAHSHPDGFAHFSSQDDQEEDKLLPFLQSRVPTRAHGTLVFSNDSVAGRIYAPERAPAEQLLIIGSRVRMHADGAQAPVSQMFDRQVQAFGPDIQRALAKLHIGVVGVGGTGSAVAEQIYRLGVGRLSVFDGDRLAESNLNRVYGSTLANINENKALVAKAHLDRIGLRCDVIAHKEPITFESVARCLRNCDAVFGCTDKQLPRAILSQLALTYHVPVFDIGVLIDSHDGSIRGVHGRVTTLMAGEACLFCRGRISPEAIRVEALSATDRHAQIDQGYAPELDEPAPAVIAFTTLVASAAVAELVHRLTGFMGPVRRSSEVLLAIDENRFRTNRVAAREDCQCSDASIVGRGDEEPFLGMMWGTVQTK
jgi:molybdopterin/thiamine biosynthesis adenylyltransferase